MGLTFGPTSLVKLSIPARDADAALEQHPIWQIPLEREPPSTLHIPSPVARRDNQDSTRTHIPHRRLPTGQQARFVCLFSLLLRLGRRHQAAPLSHPSHRLRGRIRFEYLLESGPEVLTLIKRIDADVSNLKPDANHRTIAAVSKTMASHPTQHTPPTLGMTIQASGTSFRRLSQQLLSCLDQVVHQVTSLDLTLCFAENIQFADFVLEFPRLKSLTLGHISLINGVRASSHRESGISHITLRETALCSGIRWFISDRFLPLPSLTSLDVRFPTSFRTPERLAEAHAPTVRTLRFGIPIIPSPTSSWNELTGDACKF